MTGRLGYRRIIGCCWPRTCSGPRPRAGGCYRRRVATVDRRKPAAVSDAFRARVADRLLPLGFVARAANKALVRKRGRNLHRVAFASSHHNAPGQVAAWVRLEHEDAATRRLARGWRAGGQLDGRELALELETNVAVATHADRLVETIVEQLAFFDLLEQPRIVAAEVMRRYVPGILDPDVVAPYLRAHLGAGAVIAYAAALLRGRPELAPAFVTALDEEDDGRPLRDHGTQLAHAVRTHGGGARPDVPAGAVRSPAPAARSLRSFFGLQLRAWGEPAAAHALHAVGDDVIVHVQAAQQALAGPLVDSPDAARLALEAALGEDRAPRRRAPSPRLFQYHARHEPFAPT